MNRRSLSAIAIALALGLAWTAPADAARGGTGGARSGGGHSGSAHGSGGHAGNHGNGGFRNHARAGVFVGGPLFAFGFPFAVTSLYGPFGHFDAYPPMLPEPAQSPAYIEMPGSADAPRKATSYWYYCSDPSGYYPYIQHCPGGWQQVAPNPAQGAY
jgi:hypothetical protein